MLAYHPDNNAALLVFILISDANLTTFNRGLFPFDIDKSCFKNGKESLDTPQCLYEGSWEGAYFIEYAAYEAFIGILRLWHVIVLEEEGSTIHDE